MNVDTIYQLIGIIIGNAAGSLVGAVLLRFVVRWVCKFTPPYWMSYTACFCSSLAGSSIGFVIGLVSGISGSQNRGAVMILTLMLGIILGASILGVLIRHPKAGKIGFGNAFIVSLALCGVGVCLVFGGWLISAFAASFATVTGSVVFYICVLGCIVCGWLALQAIRRNWSPKEQAFVTGSENAPSKEANCAGNGDNLSHESGCHKIECPHCSQHLDVPEEMLGTHVACPTCNGAIQLPECLSPTSVVVTKQWWFTRYRLPIAVAVGLIAVSALFMTNPTVAPSFSPFLTLEKRLVGNWRKGSTDYVFQSGTMAIRSSGHVYASYQVLDNETLRYRQINTEWIVKVKFPTATTMIWYRGQTDELREWMTFQRMSEEELAEETEVRKKKEQAALDAEFERLATEQALRQAVVRKQAEQEALLVEAQKHAEQVSLLAEAEWQNKAALVIKGERLWYRDNFGRRYAIEPANETYFLADAKTKSVVVGRVNIWAVGKYDERRLLYKARQDSAFVIGSEKYYDVPESKKADFLTEVQQKDFTVGRVYELREGEGVINYIGNNQQKFAIAVSDTEEFLEEAQKNNVSVRRQ